MFEVGNVKHGFIGPGMEKTNLSVQLTRLYLKSPRTIEPVASGWIEQASKDQVNPEVVWVLTTSIIDIQ
jgi:hypothetical protein